MDPITAVHILMNLNIKLEQNYKYSFQLTYESEFFHSELPPGICDFTKEYNFAQIRGKT
jgi:hypothetical protein